MSKIDGDILLHKMALSTSKETAKLAFQIISNIQLKKPHEQINALSAIFVLLLDVFKVSHSDVLGIAHNMIYGLEDMRPEFKAIKAYIENELG